LEELWSLPKIMSDSPLTLTLLPQGERGIKDKTFGIKEKICMKTGFRQEVRGNSGLCLLSSFVVIFKHENFWHIWHKGKTFGMQGKSFGHQDVFYVRP
jgi:hypothetical protein